ncbi:30S ribosomal protein S20 [Patescibacteria group bacterium]|nr:30S ribosomal protein S20 [Patescibacteria group bacterium]MBU1034663.1 30S ribosomal protein S20 [Patescibacteria group bacterium]MBU1629560.1 30S ribosomal protein S20 [Patescibacteria group bacterium]MBU1907817.1 30S ribosomal protein S20 [Patescibacteria group bacterium]
MPNKRSAKKDLRQARSKALANLKIKTHVKALYKKSEELIKSGQKYQATEAARAFQQAVDKAAKRRVVSFNKAARKKQSLMKALNK